MTILGPLLFSGLMIIPIWLALQEQASHHIEVIDDSRLIEGFMKNSKNLKFDYPPVSIEVARRDFYNTDYTAILWIPENVLASRRAIIYYKKHPGVVTQERIRSGIENVLYENQLEAQGIDLAKVDAAQIPINVMTEKQSESGESEKTNTNVNMAIGFGSGILIYLFIFLYGVQVMRGVIEEKTSRIVEVIVSSVRPFQLMMGKIIGIAMVGLTQFLLWIILTMVIVSIAQVTVLSEFADLNNPALQQGMIPSMPNQLPGQNNIQFVEAAQIYKDVLNINFVHVILAFLFYFLGGYLLYSALFAAVGSAVDNEADTQQFMMPITIPLVVAFIAAQFIMQDPEGPLAFWFSIIPLTSPVVMMVRLPFGVPPWEIALSMTLLVIAFVFFTWLAGKIYRTGILMYGKKVTYKELWKWMRYKY